MKTLTAGWLLLFVLCCNACSGQRKGADGKSPAFRFQNAVILLADSATGARALSVGDSYTKSFTKFDLQGRLGRTDESGTEADYLKLAAQQCRGWSSAQQDSLRASFMRLESWLKNNGITLRLPDTVRVIHSKCEEELGSEGYTRTNNIVLNGGTDLHLVSHELFHVLSRHNPGLRDKLYEVIGFRKCAPVAYQTAFKGQTITNPDCPVVEHFTILNLPLDDHDLTEQEPANATLVLYSTKRYAGGNVFVDYLKIGLLELEGDGAAMKPRLVNGEPNVTELDNYNMPLAVRALKVNTLYLLHPEEISAEHFSQLTGGDPVDHPEKLTAMRKVLQGK